MPFWTQVSLKSTQFNLHNWGMLKKPTATVHHGRGFISRTGRSIPSLSGNFMPPRLERVPEPLLSEIPVVPAAQPLWSKQELLLILEVSSLEPARVRAWYFTFAVHLNQARFQQRSGLAHRVYKFGTPGRAFSASWSHSGANF